MADSKTPLHDEWEKFRRLAVHPDTDAFQLADMRRIFLAGAMAMFLVSTDERNDPFIAVEFAVFEAEMTALASLAEVQDAGSA